MYWETMKLKDLIRNKVLYAELKDLFTVPPCSKNTYNNVISSLYVDSITSSLFQVTGLYFHRTLHTLNRYDEACGLARGCFNTEDCKDCQPDTEASK